MHAVLDIDHPDFNEFEEVLLQWINLNAVIGNLVLSNVTTHFAHIIDMGRWPWPPDYYMYIATVCIALPTSTSLSQS